MHAQTIASLGHSVPRNDLRRAILKNRIYARQLGWQTRYPEILNQLGFRHWPNGNSFTRAVSNWQSNQGMKADGTIGPAVWKEMQAEIAAPATVVRTPIPSSRLDRFEHNSATLTDLHRREIAQIAERIAQTWQRDVPIMTVRVVGHTDSTGKPVYNQTLGLRRALAVRKELQEGLRKRKLFYKVLVLASSKGARERIDLTNTPEGKMKNRRVEVFLSTKKLMPIAKKEAKIDEKTIPWILSPNLDQKPEDRPEQCNEEYFRNLVKECDRNQTICRTKCRSKNNLATLTDPAMYCPPLYPVDKYCEAKRKAARDKHSRELRNCEQQCNQQQDSCISSMRQFTNCPTQRPRRPLIPFDALPKPTK